MDDVKTHVKTLGSQAKVQAKNIGTYAKAGMGYVGTKRVMMAGRSVNPFVVGVAAAALIGTATYLILKRRNRNRMFAGHTQMNEQFQPAK